MALGERLTPTLFDKLVANIELAGLTENDDDKVAFTRESLRFYSLPKLERFNEAALRTTLRRDLAWLLNTTFFGASVDLEHYPEIQKSVLNFGVPDLAGRALSRRVILQRAREIRRAIQDFEPRIDPTSLRVEPVEEELSGSRVTFLIEGEVVTSMNSFGVAFRTEMDVEIASVEIKE